MNRLRTAAPPPAANPCQLRVLLNAGGAGHRKLIFDLATGDVQICFADKLKEKRHG